MTVWVDALDQRRIDVTGAWYEPVSKFQNGEKRVDPQTDERLSLALRIGALCNEAKVERHDGHETVLGDPTEAALIVVAEKAGMDLAGKSEEFVRVDELPFESIRQRMVTVHRTIDGRTIAFVKVHQVEWRDWDETIGPHQSMNGFFGSRYGMVSPRGSLKS